MWLKKFVLEKQSKSTRARVKLLLIFTLSSPTETLCLSISLSTPLDLLGISLGIHADWLHDKTISIHFQPVCSTELTGRQNSGVALFTVSS